MDIIKTYAPTNTNITPDELSAMKDLTDDQIAQLAKAYPNQPTGNAYLVYWIKGEKENEQRYPLGTWANLNGLRKLGRKDVLPFAFKKTHVRPVVNTQPAPQRVVDLSDDETKQAKGLKVKATDTDHVKVINPVINPVIDPVIDPVTLIETPELTAARAELQQAVDDKAHHMTIKALQKKVDELAGVKDGADNGTKDGTGNGTKDGTGNGTIDTTNL